MWPWYPFGFFNSKDFQRFPTAEKDPWKRRTKSRSWTRFERPRAKMTKHRKSIKKMAKV